MKRYLLFLSIVAVILAGSCKSKKKPSAQHQDAMQHIEDSLLVSMERTYCYGTCPVYVFKAYRDGYVTYKGIANTDLQGEYYGYLTDEERADILKNIIKLQMLDLKDEYKLQGVQDLPSTIITLRLGSKLKRIETLGEKPPAAFTTFEKYLDNVIKNIYYVKAD